MKYNINQINGINELYHYYDIYYKVTIFNTKGKRKYNEDKFIFLTKNNYMLGAIFDGHGGDKVSLYCKYNFHTIFDKIIEYYEIIKDSKLSLLKLESKLYYYLVKLIVDFDKEIFKIEAYDVGSTCVCFFLIENKIIILLNLGDSRIILNINSKIIETVDHKVSNTIEQKRILKTSNIIKDRIEGTINIARTFGDFQYKTNGPKDSAISSIPYISMYYLKQTINEYFIILASDGLFDAISTKDVVYYIKIMLINNKSHDEIINNLIFYAMHTIKSNDNITILLYTFKKRIKENNEIIINQYNTSIKALKKYITENIEILSSDNIFKTIEIINANMKSKLLFNSGLYFVFIIKTLNEFSK